MSIKKQFKWFTIFEYEKEQDYLREMHKAGWKFIKVKGLGTYCFENLKNQKHLLNCFLSLLNLLPNYIVLTKLDIIFTYYPTPPFFTCFVVKIRVKKGGEKQIENNEQTLGEPV